MALELRLEPAAGDATGDVAGDGAYALTARLLQRADSTAPWLPDTTVELPARTARDELVFSIRFDADGWILDHPAFRSSASTAVPIPTELESPPPTHRLAVFVEQGMILCHDFALRVE